VTTLLEVRERTVAVPHDGATAPVVDSVSFDIERGEFVGLVGESGSGKSLTARSLIRLLPRVATDSGSVRFDELEVTTLSRRGLRELRARRIAMIFQDPRAHIDPLWRVEEHLAEGLRLRGVRSRAAIRREAAELLAAVGIVDPERCLRSYPDQLSGGMLQRVMIAGALAVEPELLIADEPTTALDVTTQAEIMAILADLRRERQLSMLFITHDLELAAAICDRVLVMYAGTIVEDGPCTAVFKDHLHPYTWGLLKARPALHGARARLTVIAGQPVSGLNAPAGCPFHTRCPWADADCREGRPELRAVASGHLSACRRIDAIRDELV
jgi:oligopeptide/dipeptide ABC transporter ATP-binding protein